MIAENIPVIDEIFSQNAAMLGDDHDGYKNHVYRMVNFCFVQGDLNDEAKEKIAIAGCFHDMGIWSAGTFDYLRPSVALASEYLASTGRSAWTDEIGTMIELHHRLRRCPDEQTGLVEIFRKGDLVDFSLGLVKCGIAPDHIREVRMRFPNAGFHRMLAGLACRWVVRHPLNPVPVLRW